MRRLGISSTVELPEIGMAVYAITTQGHFEQGFIRDIGGVICFQAFTTNAPMNMEEFYIAWCLIDDIDQILNEYAPKHPHAEG